MNPNDKLTERAYTIDLTRPSTGSHLVVNVTAVSPAQAQRVAQDQFPGWQVRLA